MTNAIQQSTTIAFLQEIIYKPFAEGGERINRAIEGVNLHHIQHPKMNLLDRGWSLLVGVCLMMPVINSILWICMKIFGNPEILSEPFTPDSPQAPELGLEEIVVEDPGIAPPQKAFNVEPPRGMPLSIREMKYRGRVSLKSEETENVKETNSNWKFETYPDTYYVTSDDETMHSETSFDLNWNQKTHFIKMGETSVRIQRIFNSLIVTGFHNGEQIDRKLELRNESYPWIQQPTTGFRPFVLSTDKTLRFYGVHPIEHVIRECFAEKEDDILEPYGKVTKVSFKFNDVSFGMFFNELRTRLGHCWFDPENGDLLKMKYRIGPWNWGESNIVKDP